MIAFVLFSCVGCDQVTKTIARQSLPKSEPLRFLNDLFRMQYAENQGGFLSMGVDLPDNMRFWLFTICVGFVLASLLIYVLASKKMPITYVMAITLIIGGGIGNLIDRIFNDGAVVDFMNFGVGFFRTGVFNVADICITVGASLLFLFSVHHQEKAL